MSQSDETDQYDARDGSPNHGYYLRSTPKVTIEPEIMSESHNDSLNNYLTDEDEAEVFQNPVEQSNTAKSNLESQERRDSSSSSSASSVAETSKPINDGKLLKQQDTCIITSNDVTYEPLLPIVPLEINVSSQEEFNTTGPEESDQHNSNSDTIYPNTKRMLENVVGVVDCWVRWKRGSINRPDSRSSVKKEGSHDQLRGYCIQFMTTFANIFSKKYDEYSEGAGNKRAEKTGRKTGKASKATDVVGNVLSAVPVIGPIAKGFCKVAAATIDHGGKVQHHTKSKAIINILHERPCENVILKQAFQVFCLFERQFGMVNDVNAVRKLAQDASDRVYNYIYDAAKKGKKVADPNNSFTKDWYKDYIVLGVIEGDSNDGGGSIEFRKINDVCIKVQTSDIFTKSGIRNKTDGSTSWYLCEKQNAESEIFSYRWKYSAETLPPGGRLPINQDEFKDNDNLTWLNRNEKNLIQASEKLRNPLLGYLQNKEKTVAEFRKQHEEKITSIVTNMNVILESKDDDERKKYQSIIENQDSINSKLDTLKEYDAEQWESIQDEFQAYRAENENLCNRFTDACGERKEDLKRELEDMTAKFENRIEGWEKSFEKTRLDISKSLQHENGGWKSEEWKLATEILPLLKKLLIISMPLFLLIFGLLILITIYGNYDANVIHAIQSGACNYYKKELDFIEMQPWKEGSIPSANDNSKRRPFKDVYMQQTFYRADGVSCSDITHFISMDTNGKAQRLLLVADQGQGKSTAAKNSALNWCNSNFNSTLFTLQYLRMQYGWNYFYEQGLLPISWQTFVDKYFSPSLLLMIDNVPWSLLPMVGKETKTFFNNMFQSFRKSRPAELLFTFELKDICKYQTIIDAIKGKMLQDCNTTINLDAVINRGIKYRSIILFLDGLDEYRKMEITNQFCIPEVNSIVERETKQNIHLIVTSRSWKSEKLLNVDLFGYAKVRMNKQFSNKERNYFISKFFRIPEDSQELITYLDTDNGTIIPETMQREPRMLLYICNIWDQGVHQRNKVFMDRGNFFDELHELMRRTYNVKYPHHKKDKEWVLTTRKKLKEYAVKNKDNLYTKHDDFYSMFGDDELVYDLFCMGLFVIEKSNVRPWDDDSPSVEPAPVTEDSYGSKAIKLFRKLVGKEEAIVKPLVRLPSYEPSISTEIHPAYPDLFEYDEERSSVLLQKTLDCIYSLFDFVLPSLCITFLIPLVLKNPPKTVSEWCFVSTLMLWIICTFVAWFYLNTADQLNGMFWWVILGMKTFRFLFSGASCVMFYDLCVSRRYIDGKSMVQRRWFCVITSCIYMLIAILKEICGT